MSEITVDNMISSLKSPCVLRMKLIKNKNEKIIFIFEGDDDYDFYSSVIKYSGFCDEFDHLVGNGKQQLVDLYNELINESQDSDCDDSALINDTYFFVDQDYSSYCHIGDNIFTTPYYSIENHLFNERVISHFLKTKFKLNSNDKDIILEITNGFNDIKSEFLKEMKALSTLLYKSRLLNLSYEFPRYSEIIKGINNNSILFKNYSTIRLEKLLKNKDVIDIPDDINELNLIRGKYCFYLMKDYLMSVKLKINDYLHNKKVEEKKQNNELNEPYRCDIKISDDDINILTLSCGCGEIRELNSFLKLKTH